jgi:hypothetical protein
MSLLTCKKPVSKLVVFDKEVSGSEPVPVNGAVNEPSWLRVYRVKYP